ncbi:MAG: FAD-binding oxidoreductase [Pseudomonadota bacterium]
MDILTLNDEPGIHPHGSYYAATAGPIPHYPSLEGDIETDVCVIGAGYTGLTAALSLAEAGIPVVVLEANRVGWGASGRNGGQIHPGQRREQDDLEEIVGTERARRLWKLSERALTLVQELISDHAIDCDYRPGLIHAALRASEAKETRHYAEYLNEQYGFTECRYLDQNEIRTEIATDAYKGGLFLNNGGHLHPLRYAIGLAQAAINAGTTLYEKSRVSDIQYGGEKHIQTKHGSVRAKTVILALNGYHGDLVASLTRHVMPINNFIIATEPLGEERARALIPRNAAVSDSNFVVNYYRLSADHRMIFGGGENYRYRFPNNLSAIARNRMLALFPDLQDARVDYAWGGTLGITRHRLPYVEQIKDGVLTAGGFSGHGVALATLSGRILADAVLGNDEDFLDIMAIPAQPFPGGTLLRWPLLVLAMAAASLRDRFS